MKSSKQTLTESSFVLIFSTAIVKIIGAFFKIPLASDMFLGEVGFGYYSVAHDIYMPFYTLAISGLPIAVSHIIAEKISQNRKTDVYTSFTICKRLFVLFGVVFSLVMAFLSVPMILSSQYALNASYSIFTITPSVFLCFIISAYRGYFEGFSNMYPTAFSKVIEALVKLILGLVATYLIVKFTNNTALAAAGAMLAITIGTVLSTFYLYFKYKKSDYLQTVSTTTIVNTQKTDFSKILKIAIPFALASLTASVVGLLDVFTVKIPIDTASKSYFDVVISQYGDINGDVSTYLYGIRSKAFTIYNLIPTFTAALGVGALPVLTTSWAQNDKKALSDNVKYTLKLICTITFPAAFGILALSDKIMKLLYSSSSNLEGNLLAVYALAGLFAGLAIPLTTVLQSLRKHRFAITSIVVGIVLKIVISLSLVLIPQINIFSAALGTLACYLYISVSVMWGIGKTVTIKGYLPCILKPFICAMFCGFSAFLLSRISDKKIVIISAILVGILVYFGLCLITKVFTENEIKCIPFINKLIKSKK